MNWKPEILGFRCFLKLEKSVSENSIAAYIHDIEKLVQFLEHRKLGASERVGPCPAGPAVGCADRSAFNHPSWLPAST